MNGANGLGGAGRKHAASSAGDATIALGVVLFAFGVGVAWIVPGQSGALVFACGVGGSLLAYGIWVRGFQAAQNLIHRAAVERDPAVVDALLSAAERRSRNTALVHGVAGLRAQRAIDAEDLVAARAAVDEGLSLPETGVWQVHVRAARARLWAMRAFLLAADGDVPGARSDAARVRADSSAAPEALAYAALADALCARHESREALRRVLQRHRIVLFDYLPPRVRGVARALWSSAYVSVSPYRTAPAASSVQSRGLLRALLPEAASVSAASDRGEVSTPPSESARASPGSSPARIDLHGRRPGRLARTAWHAAAVVGAAVWLGALWSFALPRSSLGSFGHWIALTAFCAVAIVLPIVQSMRGRADRGLLQARRRFAQEDPGARDAFEALASSASDMVALQALVSLAFADERAGAFDAALATCSRALHRLEGIRSNAVRAFVRPSIRACRALAFAARDRADDAQLELERMTHEGGDLHELAGYRVELVFAARCGDFARVEELDRGRDPWLPIPYRDELLAELATVVAAGAASEQRRRLSAEIAHMPEMQAWLRAVVPGAVAALSSPAL